MTFRERELYRSFHVFERASPGMCSGADLCLGPRGEEVCTNWRVELLSDFWVASSLGRPVQWLSRSSLSLSLSLWRCIRLKGPGICLTKNHCRKPAAYRSLLASYPQWPLFHQFTLYFFLTSNKNITFTTHLFNDAQWYIHQWVYVGHE